MKKVVGIMGRDIFDFYLISCIPVTWEKFPTPFPQASKLVEHGNIGFPEIKYTQKLLFDYFLTNVAIDFSDLIFPKI